MLPSSQTLIPAPQLILPLGTVSGTPLAGSSTFFNQNLSSHGITPGSFFTWSWGNGGAAPRQVGG